MPLLLCHRGPGQLFEEILPHRIQNLNHQRIAHGIKNLVTHFAIDQNSLGPENGEMLGGVGLFKTDALH